MKCPVCTNVNLVMSERQGIEIDYCPECRGIWLDRNELDKIIERSNMVTENYNTKQNDFSDYENDKKDEKSNKEYKNKDVKKPKKKESFFSEMFDMFGD